MVKFHLLAFCKLAELKLAGQWASDRWNNLQMIGQGAVSH